MIWLLVSAVILLGALGVASRYLSVSVRKRELTTVERLRKLGI